MITPKPACEIDKEWCLKAAQREEAAGDPEISAGVDYDAEIDRLAARAEKAEADCKEWEKQFRVLSVLEQKKTADCKRAEAERDALREALEEFVNFAWTAVTADCEEARINLNSKISKARTALAPASTGGGADR